MIQLSKSKMTCNYWGSRRPLHEQSSRSLPLNLASLVWPSARVAPSMSKAHGASPSISLRSSGRRLASPPLWAKPAETPLHKKEGSQRRICPASSLRKGI